MTYLFTYLLTYLLIYLLCSCPLFSDTRPRLEFLTQPRSEEDALPKLGLHQRFGPGLGPTRKIHSTFQKLGDIFHAPTPKLYRGAKSAKFCFDFRHQSHLISCGFKTEQHDTCTYISFHHAA